MIMYKKDIDISSRSMIKLICVIYYKKYYLYLQKLRGKTS